MRSLVTSKNKKAGGEDLIFTELWKESNSQPRQELKEIMREIWQTEKILDD